MSAASFARLDSRIARQYEGKGFSKARSEAIGRAVAGKTAHRKWKKHGVPAEVREQRACVKEGMRAVRYQGAGQWRREFGRVTSECARKRRGGRVRPR